MSYTKDKCLFLWFSCFVLFCCWFEYDARIRTLDRLEKKIEVLDKNMYLISEAMYSVQHKVNNVMPSCYSEKPKWTRTQKKH